MSSSMSILTVCTLDTKLNKSSQYQLSVDLAIGKELFGLEIEDLMLLEKLRSPRLKILRNLVCFN